MIVHSFLKTIGFSNLSDRIDLEGLFSIIINDPTEKKYYKLKNNNQFVEIDKRFTKNMGIVIRGEIDENGKFYMEHYFPYYRSSILSAKEDTSIIKRMDTEAYTGMCDDIRLGVSLIFYLQNVVDFFNEGTKTDEVDMDMSYRNKGGLPSPIYLSALSLSGKILLPIESDEKKEKNSTQEMQYRRELITEAKKGNQEAIESLTIDDIDLYTMISRRARHEDIYSIVENSFTPYGSESDNYTVLGTILDVDSEINEITKEEIYCLTISCNDVCFQLAINKSDLLGEPLVGRRFKGNVWLQGNIDFEANKY